MSNDDEMAIEEVHRARVAPDMHWTEEDIHRPITYKNCSVELLEYTHNKRGAFIRSVVREFVVQFTNKLRSDSLPLDERLSLFQESITQVACAS